MRSKIIAGLMAGLAITVSACTGDPVDQEATGGEGAVSEVPAPAVADNTLEAEDTLAASLPYDQQCRQRAAEHYGVGAEAVTSAETQTERTDGSVPVNGSLDDGRSFQCNFDADGAIYEFVEVPADEPAPPETGALDAAETALESFQGARAGQAEMGIQRLGYEIVRSEGLTNFWYNSETEQCYSITTAQGRYAQVNAQDKSQCEG